MKKLISLMLALIMVFSLATVVGAETTEAESTAVAEAKETTVVLNKLYTTSGQKNSEGSDVTAATIFPSETLNFTATYKNGPKQVGGVTVAALETNGNQKGTMKISLPAYDTVGVYTYEIVETAGNTQAVSYSTNKITISVLVEWNKEHTDLESSVILTQPIVNGETSTGGEKNDTFTNEYELGHLDVKKTVSGNLASRDAEFTVTVTFISSMPVGSSITCVDSGSVSTIALTGSDGNYSATKDITLKHNETVHFYNIPVGVTYTVVENSQHKLAAGANVDPNSAADKDYTATNEVTDAKTIAAGTVTETINNEKSTSVQTGIVTDSAPYIILIAVCAVAAVAFVLKRRNAVEF